MQVWSDNGPIYEIISPDKNEVVELLNKKVYSILNSDKNMSIDKIYLNNIIKDLVDYEYKKRNGFGSNRNFYTFIYYNLVMKAKNKYLSFHKRKLSIKKIRPILLDWINRMLYRPPGLCYNKRYDSNNLYEDPIKYTKKKFLLKWKYFILYRPPGKRYKSVKNNFKKHASVIKKKNNKDIIEINFDLSDKDNFEKNINELKKMLKGIL